MTIFELVKMVLDELYEEGFEEHGSEIDAIIKTKMQYLSASYKKLNEEDRKPISYRDPATRFAYVYTYVAAHGDYLVQALVELRNKLGGNIFEKEQIRVSCIGGGPGSDIVAVLKYLSDFPSEPVKKITFYLLDGEQAWGDTWSEFVTSINSNVEIQSSFQKLDVTQPDSWSAQKKFLKADMFTLSYFLSEVRSIDDGTISKFWTTIFDKALPGSLFLYVDNGHDDFNAYFDQHWNFLNDIKALVDNENVIRTPRYMEQKSVLSNYESKFGRSPKLKTQLTAKVLKKLNA